MNHVTNRFSYYDTRPQQNLSILLSSSIKETPFFIENYMKGMERVERRNMMRIKSFKKQKKILNVKKDDKGKKVGKTVTYIIN